MGPNSSPHWRALSRKNYICLVFFSFPNSRRFSQSRCRCLRRYTFRSAHRFSRWQIPGLSIIYSPPFVALAVISERGGPVQKQFKVPGFVGALRWSPKGTALQYLFTRNDATNLWEQPLQGGEPKQITRFNTGRIFDFTWTRPKTPVARARSVDP